MCAYRHQVVGKSIVYLSCLDGAPGKDEKIKAHCFIKCAFIAAVKLRKLTT